jgi:hypothetical protein
MAKPGSRGNSSAAADEAPVEGGGTGTVITHEIPVRDPKVDEILKDSTGYFSRVRERRDAEARDWVRREMIRQIAQDNRMRPRSILRRLLLKIV